MTGRAAEWWSATRLRAVLDPPPRTWDHRDGLRDAAVLIPWRRTAEGRDELLYTLRRHDLPHHPGQISFPGGAREGQLEDPVATALRETWEEVGIRPEQVEVLGGLPPRLSVAGFRVHVVVGRIPADAELVPDPGEVERVLHLDVQRLRAPDAWEDLPPHGSPGRRPTPHHRIGRDVLWGLTAILTLDLFERLDRPPPE